MPNQEVDMRYYELTLGDEVDSSDTNMLTLLMNQVPRVLDDLAGLTLPKSPAHAALLSLLATVSRKVGSCHDKSLQK